MASSQKVIKIYKKKLKQKLMTVCEEKERISNLMNEIVEQLKGRVEQFLETKDEKCLSMYRKLNADLENFKEKLYVVQACFDDDSDEDGGSPDDQDENSEAKSLTEADDLGSVSSIGQSASLTCSSIQIISEDSGNMKIQSEQSSTIGDNLLSLPCADFVQKVDGLSLINIEGSENNYLTEAEFTSLPSTSFVEEVNSGSSLVDSKAFKSINESSLEQYESCHSLSQSSFYQSMSSNICETAGSKNRLSSNQSLTLPQKSTSKSQVKAKLPSLEIEIPSKLFGTLSHIVNPGDFWIQLERSEGSHISYSKEEYSHLSRPSSIKPHEYCLAPFKSSHFYYRALALEESQCGSKDLVRVHFIDHGSTEEVPLEDLRHMPFSAYSYPVQAVHCHLFGIAPIGKNWSEECIERFKEFNNLSIETDFKSKGDSYGVKLTTKFSEDLSDEYIDLSTDIALTLRLEGLALSDKNHLQQNSSLYPGVSGSSANLASNTSASIPFEGDVVMLSNDSGVSISSNYKHNQHSASSQASVAVITQSENLKTSSDKLVVDPTSACPGNEQNGTSNSMNLISFESCNSLNAQALKEAQTTNCDIDDKLCLSCRSLYCLHLNVPPPKLFFVEKDLLIVMQSYVVSPHEFYVNMVMDNSGNLDELHEQMTPVYESQKHHLPEVRVEDLSENMFCAGFYDLDKRWYRVKILNINPEGSRGDRILVQYVDYGNSALVKCSDLLPLTPEFAQHPIFAIRCSLAGVSPVGEENLGWNENAVVTFKELIGEDKCLTAQVCWDLVNTSDAYPILLWDCKESKDLLINLQMAELGVAMFDMKLLAETPVDEASKTPDGELSESNALNDWDPMDEEYNDILNSYAVDTDDLEVRTSGYRGEDDKYICKYFANRDFCPRSNCPYLHVPMLEDGVTRDREEVYCLENSLKIPKHATNFLVQVSAIISPSLFYVVLPFGSKRVDEIEQMVKQGNTYEEIVNGEAKALFLAIHRHYSNAPFQENTAVDLAFGTIVVALRHWDQKFHRGRVVDASDRDGLYKIFFVDFGDTEYVHRKNIRTILPQFFFTPFQSLLCCLAGVKPVGSNENQWKSDAVIFFKNLVEGETLLAEIVYRNDLVLHVSLRRTNQDNHQKLSDLLASEGFAELCPEVPPVVRTSRYVPG